MFQALEGINPCFGQRLLDNASVGDLYRSSGCLVNVKNQQPGISILESGQLGMV